MKAVYESSSSEAIVERGRVVTQAGYDAVKAVCIPYTHYVSPAQAVAQATPMGGAARAPACLPPARCVAPAKAAGRVGAVVGARREAVGPDVDIMVDFHGRPAS